MARGKSAPLTEEQKAAKKAEREKAKADNFVRLAEARLTRALDAMAGLRGLANRNSYSYTPDQVKVMFKALEGELTTLQNLFAPGAAVQEKTGFSFAQALAPASEEAPAETEEKADA